VAVPGEFPAGGLWRRPALRWPDVLVVAALIALLFGLLRLGPALNAPFLPKTAPSEVSTDPANLPYYAVRSLLRMFAALLISLIFTFVYATAAARLRRAEKVLIPVLDILQSVPVLGFLAVTVTAFINLFPGSELGLEAAAVFAIFTSMAWNMTFAFYHSLVSQPRDLDEAARIMRKRRNGQGAWCWTCCATPRSPSSSAARCVRSAGFSTGPPARSASPSTRRGFSLSEARSQLDTAIDWGRYGELYDYDSDDEELTLEPGAEEYL
jgi:MFS family permease